MYIRILVARTKGVGPGTLYGCALEPDHFFQDLAHAQIWKNGLVHESSTEARITSLPRP